MTRLTTRPSETSEAPLGRNLKAAQDAAGLTVDALAIEIGVSARLIQKWRQGAVKPRYENLLKLSTALEREPAWFYARHDEVRYAESDRSAA